jgi:hypothetical protein
MRGKAMLKICKKLTKKGIDLKKFVALEFFAREGDWQTQSFANKVKELHAWEIDPIFESALKKNLPHACIRIGNSYELASEKVYFERFDFIVIDNPQNTFGDYCEHFEALPLIKNLLKNDGIVIFDINLAPFDYDKFPLWRQKRFDYYSVDATKLTSNFMLNFYSKFFNSQGFDIKFCFEEKRNKEYFSYLVYFLSKHKSNSN